MAITLEQARTFPRVRVVSPTSSYKGSEGDVVEVDRELSRAKIDFSGGRRGLWFGFWELDFVKGSSPGNPLTFEKLAQVSENHLYHEIKGGRRAILLSLLEITREGSSSLSYVVRTITYGDEGVSNDFKTQSLSAAIRHFNSFIKGEV